MSTSPTPHPYRLRFRTSHRQPARRLTPFFFDWSDTANPQVPGYELHVDTTPNFTNFVLLLQGVTRSDYMVTAHLRTGQLLLARSGSGWRCGRHLGRRARDLCDSRTAAAAGVQFVRDPDRAW